MTKPDFTQHFKNIILMALLMSFCILAGNFAHAGARPIEISNPNAQPEISLDAEKKDPVNRVAPAEKPGDRADIKGPLSKDRFHPARYELNLSDGSMEIEIRAQGNHRVFYQGTQYAIDPATSRITLKDGTPLSFLFDRKGFLESIVIWGIKQQATQRLFFNVGKHHELLIYKIQNFQGPALQNPMSEFLIDYQKGTIEQIWFGDPASGRNEHRVLFICDPAQVKKQGILKLSYHNIQFEWNVLGLPFVNMMWTAGELLSILHFDQDGKEQTLLARSGLDITREELVLLQDRTTKGLKGLLTDDILIPNQTVIVEGKTYEVGVFRVESLSFSDLESPEPLISETLPDGSLVLRIPQPDGTMTVYRILIDAQGQITLVI